LFCDVRLFSPNKSCVTLPIVVMKQNFIFLYCLFTSLVNKVFKNTSRNIVFVTIP
jgi:hypothetical protein